MKEYRHARTLQKWWKFVLSQFVLRKYFCQNYLFHSSKEVFFHILGKFLKIELLKEYRHARALQKWWKFVLSQFLLRKYLLSKLFVLLIKGSVSQQFRAIFGKLNFWRNIDRRRATLTKMVKICVISICAKKIFFVKIICSTHQRKCFSTILGNFWKFDIFWRNINRRGPYKNGENLYYLNLCQENIFCQNYLFHSSKKVFLHNFRQMFENSIFEGISTGEDLTKMVKISLISICAMKMFFVKIICSTHQRKCFSTI